MPLVMDIQELKRVLEIDLADNSENTKLAFIQEYVSDLFEEVLNRKLFLRPRTEYYDGTGTQRLMLKSRPVYPAPADPAYPTLTVWVDQGAHYGATSGAFTQQGAQLVYGNDYCLQIDQDNGSSRSAILIRNGGYWPKPYARQPGLLSSFMVKDTGSIKVEYSGGYLLDDLPGAIRMGAVILIARIRQMLPLGFFVAGEGYEERSISYLIPLRRRWLAESWTWIGSYRNWKW